MTLQESYPWLDIFSLGETDSTSNQVKQYDTGKEMTVVTAEHQTAGRGQRGNSWESEEGKNLTFSILIHPQNVVASEQFILSQAISLAIIQGLQSLSPGFHIKWPNDIYWNDLKMGGILIENELCGKHIDKCVIGIGMNINQKEFVTNPPNPVSLLQITGNTHSREALLSTWLTRFHELLQQIEAGDKQPIAAAYHQALYRRTGFHPYRDANGTFWAQIDHVEPWGPIVLKDQEGHLRTYAFKEVKYILNNNLCQNSTESY